MRPLVALVEARPETVADDYRRALTLAGLDQGTPVGPWNLVAALDGARWQPGRTCPPWQVAGALVASGPTAPGGVTVAACGPRGLQAWPATPPWDALPGAALVRDAAAARGAPVPFRSRERLPALEATGAALAAPFALRHQPLLALAAADLVSPWGLEGACATLGRLVLGGHPSRRGVPAPEIRAETVAALREMFPVLGAVVDGTLWHVGPRGRALARHVIIAGDDPVAVDAVVLRLAGYGPRDVPWLKLCADRGLGAVEPEDLRLVGHTHLVGLDFALPEPTFARAVLPRLAAGFRRRLTPGRRPTAAGGPWAALAADAGVIGDRTTEA